MRAPLEVADVFRSAGPTYRAAHAGHLSLGQLKVMTAIENCRTAALGGHAEACDDCEGELIEGVRALVGPDVPIGVELDLHCHATELMFASTDAIICYKEYPHIDEIERGRELYAIGSDPAAANLYGLKVTQRVLVAFVVSGALAGLAGVLYAARYGTVNSQAGVNLELQAVGAAVIGGVAIFGGSGSVWGAALGAFLLVTINRALPILGVQDFWQRAVVGALIIGAIVLDRVLAQRQSRKLAEMRDES